MDLNKFYDYMASGKVVDEKSGMFDFFNALSQDALKITMELNNKYHTPEEIVEIFSKLTGKKPDPSFRLFPPFYTDCGKNIEVGKNVFINAGCKFQDQGGIKIGNNVLIGHNVVLATLNHDENPEKRGNIYPKPIKIEDNVWIGSNATILAGITIGKGAIVGAGAVVVRDVERNTIVAGVPAKVIRKVEQRSKLKK